ncbi:MAG: ribosome maturation factor RimP [Clostridia bacterium]|nr:ribosome maturation factor RimP [Clostridia bacterium]
MKKNIAETVEELIAPTVSALGYEIWDVVYNKVGAEYYLEITIDSEEGIGIDDCEKVHRAIDPLLDEADPIENSYRLQVSSPGIEREIRTDAHILACMGEVVELRFYAAREDGKKSVIAVLTDYQDGVLSFVTRDDVQMQVPRREIAHMNTVYFEEE